MAALIKAANAKIRSNPVSDYFCSTRKDHRYRWLGSGRDHWRSDQISGSFSRTELTMRTDFWGPASNFGIPIAAVMDMRKDPDMYVVPINQRERERVLY